MNGKLSTFYYKHSNLLLEKIIISLIQDFYEEQIEKEDKIIKFETYLIADNQGKQKKNIKKY